MFKHCFSLGKNKNAYDIIVETDSQHFMLVHLLLEVQTLVMAGRHVQSRPFDWISISLVQIKFIFSLILIL